MTGWEDIPDEVYDKFEELAFKVRSKGYTRFSADAILHQIRWEYHIDRGMRDFKCNNYWTSTLSRWFMAQHPETEGFFELRRLRSSDYEHADDPDDFYPGQQ